MPTATTPTTPVVPAAPVMAAPSAEEAERHGRAAQVRVSAVVAGIAVVGWGAVVSGVGLVQVRRTGGRRWHLVAARNHALQVGCVVSLLQTACRGPRGAGTHGRSCEQPTSGADRGTRPSIAPRCPEQGAGGGAECRAHSSAADGALVRSLLR